MTTQQPPPPWEDSIDLRQWIDALIRRWWLVAAITGVAVIAAVVVGYGFQDPTYEASGGATLPVGSSDGELGLTPRGYREFASSTPVMDEIRERLELGLSAGQLRQHYTFQIVDDNFITVTATAGSAEQAAQLADTWLQAFDHQVQKFFQQELSGQKDALGQELGRVSQDRASAEDALADFDRKNPVTVIESQLAALESELSESKQRLHELRSRSLTDLESKIADLQENIGATGGGGAPTVGPASTSATGLGALITIEEIAASSARLGFDQDLVTARLSSLKFDLLESEDRLRELTLTSIPLAQARVASLEKAVAEAETRTRPSSAGSPDGAAALDPVYLQLSQDLAETRVDLEVQQREAELLEHKVAILRGQMEDMRADLASLQAAVEDLQSQISNRRDFNQIESDLTARRREAQRLEASIPGLEERASQMRVEVRGVRGARQELEAEVNRLSSEYNSIKGELDSLLAIEPHLSDISSLSTIREPALPEAPVSPQRVRNTVLAAFLGLMMGVAIALFWEYYRSQPVAPLRNQG